MSGVQFLVDEKGHKIAVQIDLKRHRALWEDFYDNLIADKREKEPRSKFADVKARLIKAGKLHG